MLLGFQSGYSETLSSSKVPTSPPLKPQSSCRSDATSAGFFAMAALSSDSDRYVTFSFFPVLSSYSLKIWLNDCWPGRSVRRSTYPMVLTLRSASIRNIRHSSLDRGKCVSTYATYRPMSSCVVNELCPLPSRPTVTLPLLRSKPRKLFGSCEYARGSAFKDRAGYIRDKYVVRVRT